MQTWLVTGGAGFIGSCFIRSTMLDKDVHILNLDKLTYAGHLESLPNLPLDRYQFCHAGIEDSAIVARLFENFRPSAVINFAAESHVDRSIDTPADFLQTNVVGTVKLLEQSLSYYRKLPETERTSFRFLHVSTDEVYGSLGPEGRFTEQSPYQPNSPYAASKASSDMFVRAFRETYELPTLITNCSNNYGPYQFPEKLIPLVTLNAAEGKELPVYGDGSNIRDWLFVEDHCDAIRKVLAKGKVGETYNVGGDAERTNLQVVTTICDLVDEFLKRSPSDASSKQIRFVKDRPGHDKRYAIDASKIKQELGWSPQVNFEEGLRRTVQWYLSPNLWIEAVSRGKYQRQRLGTA
jgi:dTDP-glucose 4,6-dehydratase